MYGQSEGALMQPLSAFVNIYAPSSAGQTFFQGNQIRLGASFGGANRAQLIVRNPNNAIVFNESQTGGSPIERMWTIPSNAVLGTYVLTAQLLTDSGIPFNLVTRTFIVAAGVSNILNLGISNWNAPAHASNVGVSVSSNVSWSVSSNVTWLTPSPWSGSGNGSFTIFSQANTGSAQRSGTITVSGGGLTRWVTVTQAGSAPQGITLTQNSPSATAHVGAGFNGRVPVTITAPSHGSVILRGTPGQNSDNDPALFNAAGTRVAFQNFESWNFTYTIPAGTTRTYFVGTGGNVARSYVVTSIWPVSNTLNLGIGHWNAPGTASNTFVSVSANVFWSITSTDTSWLTATPWSGSGNGGFHIVAQANPNNFARTGTLTVSGGGITRWVTVSQAAGAPAGITLTQNSPTATANVQTGVGGRVPITITAPAHGGVMLRGTPGQNSDNDPALFNAAGTRVAFQNFESWNFTYTIPAGQTRTYFVGTGGNVARSYQVTSIWPVANVTVTFDANGGSVSPTSRSIQSGSRIGELPIPIRTGHSFVGWFNTPLADGGARILNTTTFHSSQTIWARWNTAVDITNLQHGTTISPGFNLTINVVATPGAVLRWFLRDITIGDHGQSLFVEQPITLPSFTITHNHLTPSRRFRVAVRAVLHGVEAWSVREFIVSNSIPEGVTVTFNGNGGTPAIPSRMVQLGQPVGLLPTAIREGFTFIGWWNTAVNNNILNDGTIVSGNVTYTAVWENPCVRE